MDSVHKRIIIHFDIDCFYAQVEMIRNPKLRGKPLGIQQKQLLVTCNYESRKRGVTKLMSLVDAQRKCPDLIIVNGEDLTHYRNMSHQISEFIQKYTPFVERLGFDENFADVSDIVQDRIKNNSYEQKFYGHVFEEASYKDDCSLCKCGCLLHIQIGSQIAADIREALKYELGITCCAGIAHNKLLSKLVASVHKPNQQTSILPHLGCQLVSSLSGIRSIPGIGHSMENRLKAKGVSSIWELQQAEMSVLKAEFGKSVAETLSKLCFGIDESTVTPFTLPQTLSDEDSFKCCSDFKDAKSCMLQLTTSLIQRLTEDTRIPRTLKLTVRKSDYTRSSRQCPIPSNVFKGFTEKDGQEMAVSRLMPILINILHKLVDVSEPFNLTLINVCFAKLVKPNLENNTIESFFPTCFHSSSKLIKNSNIAMVDKDLSRECFGNKSLTSKPASILISANLTDHKQILHVEQENEGQKDAEEIISIDKQNDETMEGEDKNVSTSCSSHSASSSNDSHFYSNSSPKLCKGKKAI